MQAGYTVSHFVFSGNEKTIECVNFPNTNEVIFYYWVNMPMGMMSYTVAIFKIKPKTK